MTARFYNVPPWQTTPTPFRLKDLDGMLRPGFYWVRRCDRAGGQVDVVEVRIRYEGQGPSVWLGTCGHYDWVPVEETVPGIELWAGPLPEPTWRFAFMTSEEIVGEVESLIDSRPDCEAFDDDLHASPAPKRARVRRLAGRAIATCIAHLQSLRERVSPDV